MHRADLPQQQLVLSVHICDKADCRCFKMCSACSDMMLPTNYQRCCITCAAAPYNALRRPVRRPTGTQRQRQLLLLPCNLRCADLPHQLLALYHTAASMRCCVVRNTLLGP